MRDSVLHRQAHSPRTSLLLAGLLLCGALLLPATPASAVLLKWDDPGVVWPSGSLGPHTFTLSNGVQATITVAKGSGTAGGFSASNQPAGSTTVSPLEDCAGGCASNAFGSAHDLAVVFDPAPSAAYPSGSVVSPIIITMQLSAPITNLQFEISDIDFSQAGSDPGSSHRLDQIVVTSNAGNPTLSFKTGGSHTFSFNNNTHTATANCTVNAQPTCNGATDTTVAPSDSGTVVVDFGAAAVSTVTITYNEAGNGLDPAFRGVGVLGNMTPVELMSFTVD